VKFICENFAFFFTKVRQWRTVEYEKRMAKSRRWLVLLIGAVLVSAALLATVRLQFAPNLQPKQSTTTQPSAFDAAEQGR
jgi:hypothetical protein